MGLAPSVQISVNTVHYGKITCRGNDMVRWVLAEAVYSHCRYADKIPLALMYQRLRKRMPAKKATMA